MEIVPNLEQGYNINNNLQNIPVSNNIQTNNNILQSNIKININNQQDTQENNNIQIHINDKLQNNIMINNNNQQNIHTNNIINNNNIIHNNIKINDGNQKHNINDLQGAIDSGKLLKEIVSDLETQNKILNDKQLYNVDDTKSLECITTIENENKEVIKNKLNEVVLELKDNELTDLKHTDVLKWVKKSIEKVSDTVKKQYSNERGYFEKKLTKARQQEMNYLKKRNIKYKQKDEYKYYNNYYKDNKSYMNNKLKYIQNNIKQQQNSIDKINNQYYNDVQNKKINVINQLSNNNIQCNFNDISLETVEFMLLENNNIFDNIGNVRDNLYYGKSKYIVNLGKYKPINSISNIKYYTSIKKLVNLVYDKNKNEILGNYKDPIYNIVKYGIIIPAVNDFITGVLEQEHSTNTDYTGWISTFKPICNNEYSLKIIDNKTNNILKLILNITDDECNIYLDTLFNEHPNTVKQYNIHNKNYYKKYANKKSFK